MSKPTTITFTPEQRARYRHAWASMPYTGSDFLQGRMSYEVDAERIIGNLEGLAELLRDVAERDHKKTQELNTIHNDLLAVGRILTRAMSTVLARPEPQPSNQE